MQTRRHKVTRKSGVMNLVCLFSHQHFQEQLLIIWLKILQLFMNLFQHVCHIQPRQTGSIRGEDLNPPLNDFFRGS